MPNVTNLRNLPAKIPELSVILSRFPGWVPENISRYITNTEAGYPLRQMANMLGIYPSTLSRQMRRIEKRRDDPLFDAAIRELVLQIFPDQSEPSNMLDKLSSQMQLTEAQIDREGARILRRLNEKKAFLAVSAGLPRAVVFRKTIPGKPTRIAVVENIYVKAFLLRDWLICTGKGDISKYEISRPGRMALKRLLAARSTSQMIAGFAEAPDAFAHQHREMTQAEIDNPLGQGVSEAMVNLRESPLMILSRKRNADGSRFITARQLEAGERLREDFEEAQMGPSVAQNWEHFLTPGTRGQGARGQMTPSDGPSKARERLQNALEELGPGLKDIALRCCCLLEGLEAAEHRLGWSARSGKVVLRIALERLANYYEGEGRARSQPSASAEPVD